MITMDNELINNMLDKSEEAFLMCFQNQKVFLRRLCLSYILNIFSIIKVVNIRKAFSL